MVRPKHSLDPASQPWARSVNAELDALAKALQIQQQDTANAFKITNNALSQLGTQISDINLLLSRQAVPASAEVVQSGTSMVAGWNNVCTSTFTIPAWASKAVVMSVGTFYALDTISGGLAFLDLRLSTAGTAGQDITLPVTVGASVAESSGAVAQVQLNTGGAGASVSVVLQARPSNPAAYTSWKSSVSSVVIYTI